MRPLSGDTDHEANHPAGLTVARLVAFIPLHGSHERQVVNLACQARRPASHDCILEHGARGVHRGHSSVFQGEHWTDERE